MRKKFVGVLALVLSVFGLTTNVFAEGEEVHSSFVDEQNISVRVEEKTLYVEFTLLDDIRQAYLTLHSSDSSSFSYETLENTYDNLKKGDVYKITYQFEDISKLAHFNINMYGENGIYDSIVYTLNEEGNFVYTEVSKGLDVHQAAAYKYNQEVGSKKAQLYYAYNGDGGYAVKINEYLSTHVLINEDEFKKIDNDTERVDYLYNVIVEGVKQNVDSTLIIPDNYSQDYKVTPSILDEVKATGKKSTLAFGNAEWTFDGAQMDSTDFTISPIVEYTFSLEDFEYIEGANDVKKAAPEGSKIDVVRFEYHGELPKGTTVTVFLGGKYKDGTYLTLYYYENNSLTPVAKNLQVNDDKVVLPLEHCSLYALEEQKGYIEEVATEAPVESTTTSESTEEVAKKSNNAQTAGLNVIFYSGLGAVSLIGLILSVRKKRIA